MRKILVSLFCVATLAACAQPGGQGVAPPGETGTNETTEGPEGGGTGGPASAPPGQDAGKPAAPLSGVILAGVLSGPAGAALDQADEAALDHTTQNALETKPTNQPVQWANPDTGHYGTIMSVRTYQPHPGNLCREFQQTVVVGGQRQQAYGTACRQPDGVWKIQQS